MLRRCQQGKTDKRKSALTCFLLIAFFSQLIEAMQINDNRQHGNNSEEECVLKVGWIELPPFQLRDNSNYFSKKPIGRQVDLIDSIARESGCSLMYSLDSFVANLEKIKNGNLDVIFDASMVKGRESFGYYSQPYRKDSLVLYARQEFIEECRHKSIKHLIADGVQLGLVTGGYYGELIEEIKNIPSLNSLINYQDNDVKLYQQVVQSKVDLLIHSPEWMGYNRRLNRNVKAMRSCQVVIYSSEVYLLFSKKTASKALVKRFNQAIEKVKKSDSYKKYWNW